MKDVLLVLEVDAGEQVRHTAQVDDVLANGHSDAVLRLPNENEQEITISFLTMKSIQR